jgi:hypothetical protein
MTKNVLAFIGLWVVVATVQKYARACMKAAMEEETA